MKSESKLREIEKCKKILANPLIGYNQKVNIETYLKTLKNE